MILPCLLIILTTFSYTYGRAIDTRTVPVAIDSYGNRVFLIREQKHPMAIHPHRSMMITGIYQPKYRASSRQATGVFAQGNAVSSDALLGENVQKYHEQSDERIDESEISSAEAEASPGLYETPLIDDKQSNPATENVDNDVDNSKKIHQTHKDEESLKPSTEIPSVVEQSTVSQKDIEQRPIKKNKPLNKGNKTKIHDDEDDYDVEEDDEDDDNVDYNRPASYNPLKGNRRGILPAFNNFFPMVFSFPKSLARRSGTESSSPGMITAIANSYSTGKGGVASSVATAYGGSPNSKKKLQKSYDE